MTARKKSAKLFLVIAPFLLTTGVASGQVLDLGDIPNVQIQCLAESQGAGSIPPNPLADGSWRQFRRDKRLTGRSPLVGNFSCPQVLWSVNLNARSHWVSIQPASGSETFGLSLVDPPGNNWSVVADEFDVNGVNVDLDGDGSNDTLTSNPDEAVGDLLPGLPGIERITCTQNPGVCTLENYSGGWNTIWVTDPEEGFSDYFYPFRPLVGDFDNDGEPELAVAVWYHIYVWDLESGSLETSGNFWADENEEDTSGRSYGWFGAFNIDSDPETEFIILGHFEQFISVFDWQGGQIVELWDHQIEAGTSQNEAVHQAGFNPVADINGDGFPEIVTSILNETGDGRWHVVAYEAGTGNVILDLVDRHLAGMADLDGDGVSELLLSNASGRVIAEHGNIEVQSFLQNEQSILWSSEAEGFETYNTRPYPQHFKTGQPYMHRTVFVQDGWATGNPVFGTRERVPESPDVKLRFYQVQQGGVTEIASVTGPRLEVLSVSSENPAAGILLRSFTETVEESRLILQNLFAETRLSTPKNMNDTDWNGANILVSSPVVAPLQAGGTPTILIQDHGENIRAFQVANGDEPELRWSVPGRGMYSGQPLVAGRFAIAPVMVADLDGDGDLETLVADQSDNSAAAIRALAPNGEVIWESALDIQGQTPQFGAPGLTNWMAGHFTNQARADLIVAIRKSFHNTEALRMLSGLDGSLQWKKDTSGFNTDCPWAAPKTWFSGAGGTHMPVFDFDGDGLDDVLDAHSNLYDIVRGADGTLLLDRWTSGNPACDNAEMLFEEPISGDALTTVGDWNAAPGMEVLYGMNTNTLAILEPDGSPIWHTPFFEGTPSESLQGIGDISGGAGLEVVSVGHCRQAGEEIQVFSADSGQKLHSVSLPEVCEFRPPRAVVTGDIDGDGFDEALFTFWDTLVALGIRGDGSFGILWRASFDEAWTLGDVAIADVDGTGRPRILVANNLNHLYALGSNKAPEGFEINAGLNDAWVNADAPLQGMFITVFPTLKLVFAAWFTFDSVPPSSGATATFGAADQRWVTAVGGFEGSRATLKAELTTGGKFNAPDPRPVQDTEYGTIEIDFTNCNHAWVEADFPPAGVSGMFQITRVVESNVPLCESLSELSLR